MAAKTRFPIGIPPEIRDELEQWANAENRSLSNLVETILINAVRERGKKHPEFTVEFLPDGRLEVRNSEGIGIKVYDSLPASYDVTVEQLIKFVKADLEHEKRLPKAKSDRPEWDRNPTVDPTTPRPMDSDRSFPKC